MTLVVGVGKVEELVGSLDIADAGLIGVVDKVTTRVSRSPIQSLASCAHTLASSGLQGTSHPDSSCSLAGGT